MNGRLKYFTIVLITLVTCTGCNQDDKILVLPNDQYNQYEEPSNTEVIRYKNGTVLLKDSGTYNATIHKNSVNPEARVGKVDFGPKDINFGS
jgi:hypothetical protein